MLKSHFNIALRNLLKYKSYTIINIAGLAIGFACFTLILLFVRHELSYDRHHRHAESIYRIAIEIKPTRAFSAMRNHPNLDQLARSRISRSRQCRTL